MTTQCSAFGPQAGGAFSAKPAGVRIQTPCAVQHPPVARPRPKAVRSLGLWRFHPQAQPQPGKRSGPFHIRSDSLPKDSMRRLEGPVALRRSLAACLLILSVGLGCQVPAQRASTTNSGAPHAAQNEARVSVVSRDLSQDESTGGHTLRKHVGRTDDQLRERLRHERNISAASTWNDRETAERAVGMALDQNRDKIDRWLNRSEGHPNLVIDYGDDTSHPLGRSLRRNAGQPEPCAHATIVLKWAGPKDYYVLTSYPECR
jgi:hypothetical protein